MVMKPDVSDGSNVVSESMDASSSEYSFSCEVRPRT